MTENFGNILLELQSIKAPGVSKSRIKKLTEIAVTNVQSESILVQKLYTHFMSTPSSHKLGSLYVIDSIVRAYVDESRKKGENINNNAPEGTPAAAVNRIEGLIETIVDNIMSSASDQKAKVEKLVDIWEKAQTFKPHVIESIRRKHFKAPTPVNVPTATPQSNVAPDASSLLQVLSSLRTSSANANSTNSDQQANNLLNLLGSQQGNQNFSNNNQPSKDSYGSYGRQNDRPRNRSRSPGRRRNNDMRRRSRSPQRSRDRGSPEVGERNLPGTPHYRPTNISYDEGLPSGCIRASSRTLFIGGVPPYMSKEELAGVLRPYAEVQSVTINNERKHAFVKVYSRLEAEAIKNKFEELNESGGLALRVRWGVGFGPRDCCDYSTGVSVVPIARLTDADKRWTVHAEWGGTGGKPLVPGICIEEPDIEIGAGVSSKAISKRMPTNSAKNGPKSTNPQERWGRGERGSDSGNANHTPLGSRQSHQPPSQTQPPAPNFMGGNNNPLGMLLQNFSQFPGAGNQQQPLQQQQQQQQPQMTQQQALQALQNLQALQGMMGMNPQMASFFQQQNQHPPN